MRYTQLVFSPTGGVRKAAGLLSAAISDRFETIDLSLTLNGQKSARFSEEDVCLIAVPCFGGRVPEIALTRLAQTSGGGARTILLCAYGNRADEDTLPELRDAARKAGYFPVAAVRAVAQHSIIPEIAAGRPDDEDAAKAGAVRRGDSGQARTKRASARSHSGKDASASLRRSARPSARGKAVYPMRQMRRRLSGERHSAEASHADG